MGRSGSAQGLPGPSTRRSRGRTFAFGSPVMEVEGVLMGTNDAPGCRDRPLMAQCDVVMLACVLVVHVGVGSSIDVGIAGAVKLPIIP